jgi:DNA-binding SARP family transcriptional activator
VDVTSRVCDRLQIRVLGCFELIVNRSAVRLPAYAERLLGYLAVVEPSLRREQLAGRLWADSTQARAQASLRNALWRIRQASSRVVEATRDRVLLGDEVEIDLAQSHRFARDLIEDRVAVGSIERALAVLDRDLLPSWDDDWIVIKRERVRQLHLHALEALSRSLVRQGRFADAIEAGYAAVHAEPLRESAHTVLIEAHLGEGNRSEAIHQLAVYRTLLDEELGLVPSPILEELVASALGV